MTFLVLKFCEFFVAAFCLAICPQKGLESADEVLMWFRNPFEKESGLILTKRFQFKGHVFFVRFVPHTDLSSHRIWH